MERKRDITDDNYLGTSLLWAVAGGAVGSKFGNVRRAWNVFNRGRKARGAKLIAKAIPSSLFGTQIFKPAYFIASAPLMKGLANQISEWGTNLSAAGNEYNENLAKKPLDTIGVTSAVNNTVQDGTDFLESINNPFYRYGKPEPINPAGFNMYQYLRRQPIPHVGGVGLD